MKCNDRGLITWMGCDLEEGHLGLHQHIMRDGHIEEAWDSQGRSWGVIG